MSTSNTNVKFNISEETFEPVMTKVGRELRRYSNWITSFVPESIRKTVSEKTTSLKNRITNIYNSFISTEEPVIPTEEPVIPTEEPVISIPVEIENAFKKKVRTFRIEGRAMTMDYKTFLRLNKMPTVTLLDDQAKPIKIRLLLFCQFYKVVDEEKIFTDSHFSTKNEVVTESTDLSEIYDVANERLIELLENFQKNGSGWIFEKVLHFDIHINEFKPLRGSSFIELPKSLANKTALVNPKNEDAECFKWCMTEAVYPQSKNRGRITKKSKENSELFNWEGAEFPMNLKKIDLFETNNPDYAVNVLGYEGNGKDIFPLRISKFSYSRTVVNLLLISEDLKQHYIIVQDLSRLLSKQVSKHKEKIHICLNCMNPFPTEESHTESVKTHTEYCRSHEMVKIEMPGEDKSGKKPCLKFKGLNKKLKVPFVIYADFESFTEKFEDSVCSDDDVSYPRKYQKHVPSGFCSYITYRGGMYKKPVVFSGQNVAEKFCKHIERETQEIYDKYLKRSERKPMRMTRHDEDRYRKTDLCHICKEVIVEGSDNLKVRDHDHLTGRFRGAAHKKCNLKFKEPDFIPVVFHNLSGYDSHLFIKQLGVSKGDIDCIPNNEEKYISFTKNLQVDTYADEEEEEKRIFLKIRFIDSFKFMSSGLDSLVKNLTKGVNSEHITHTKNRFQGKTNLLLRKGVYPYDYMDSPERMEETQLPDKESFYSILNGTHISHEDYEHAQKVWKAFNMKTMKDYHDLYLESDVLLLADVFENFREVCIRNYELDPAWYYTSPGLSWDAVLKKTKVELELLTDYDMLMTFEKGVRGGVSMISNRYGKANNKYMKDFNEMKESSYIQYLDANNLYGWAMSEKMPYKDFEWSKERDLKKIFKDEDVGYVLEVDLEYPEELHDLHNDYPLAPEVIKIGKVNKLTPNFNDKIKYVLHHKNLKQYLSLGLKLTKIHRVIEFKQSKWLASYIALNTELRTAANNDFEKDFFKLMNNSVFGKTMENIRNRVNVQLVTSEEKLTRLTAKPSFDRRTIFSKDLVAVHLRKTKLTFNKPIYVGMSILDVSKTLMYDFHYGYMKEKFGEDVKLLMTDTDSLVYEIKTEDFYKDIGGDVEEKFDTSAYPKDHPSGIKTGVNKKVIGMMKDECSGRQITEFVGLRAKLYALKMEDLSESKKCKGIKKSVVKSNITFENYKETLFGRTKMLRKMNVIRSHKHEIYSEEVNKVALSGDDDKRIVMEDRIRTMAYGHRRTRTQ